MDDTQILDTVKAVLENMPPDWINLTTHRLDIYNEERAKTEFLEEFDASIKSGNSDRFTLSALPTAYDYIRLGHPLSSVLEWAVAHLNELKPKNVISFSSKTMPVLAVLRKNLLDSKNTRICFTKNLPRALNADLLRRIYGYKFELEQVAGAEDIGEFDGSTIFLSQEDNLRDIKLLPTIDFYVQVHPHLGSILLTNGSHNDRYISEIQHVRRRETVAMTPSNSYAALQTLTGQSHSDSRKSNVEADRKKVKDFIQKITNTNSEVLVASSGLSIQYAIMMGLIHQALEKHPGKAIKFIVPPNCYGGTNDQARRVAACLDSVEVVDLPVDSGQDMVQSVNRVLDKVAAEDAIPYIIAEIPTNPRVEVPDLKNLQEALSTPRDTAKGKKAIDPVFILDQTFCPNVHFLGEGDILSGVRAIAYVSGSKFPSGGRCTAGYCVANDKAAVLMGNIALHMELCDNQVTNHQLEILAEQLPSMNQRIEDAYKNTREFVNFIHDKLPDAKINFVSEELAGQGFTPSVFALDLPTKGDTPEEREAYKRAQNLKLIKSMISEIPNESKYCVSYGQLKGCYWTIPATSTQGTTQEGDKDYIVRISVSPDLDLERHKKVFSDFIENR